MKKSLACTAKQPRRFAAGGALDYSDDSLNSLNDRADAMHMANNPVATGAQPAQSPVQQAATQSSDRYANMSPSQVFQESGFGNPDALNAAYKRQWSAEDATKQGMRGPSTGYQAYSGDPSLQPKQQGLSKNAMIARANSQSFQRKPLPGLEPLEFADGGKVETADELMARMSAKYGAPAAGPVQQAPAPVPKPAPQQTPPQQPGGMIARAAGLFSNRAAQIDKAAGYKNGGKITGPGTPTSDSIAAEVEETGEPIRVANKERIVSHAQDQALEQLAKHHGFESLDAMLEKMTGKPVGPTIKGDVPAAEFGWSLGKGQAPTIYDNGGLSPEVIEAGKATMRSQMAQPEQPQASVPGASLVSAAQAGDQPAAAQTATSQAGGSFMPQAAAAWKSVGKDVGTAVDNGQYMNAAGLAVAGLPKYANAVYQDTFVAPLKMAAPAAQNFGAGLVGEVKKPDASKTVQPSSVTKPAVAAANTDQEESMRESSLSELGSNVPQRDKSMEYMRSMGVDTSKFRNPVDDVTTINGNGPEKQKGGAVNIINTASGPIYTGRDGKGQLVIASNLDQTAEQKASGEKQQYDDAVVRNQKLKESVARMESDRLRRDASDPTITDPNVQANAVRGLGLIHAAQTADQHQQTNQVDMQGKRLANQQAQVMADLQGRAIAGDAKALKTLHDLQGKNQDEYVALHAAGGSDPSDPMGVKRLPDQVVVVNKRTGQRVDQAAPTSKVNVTAGMPVNAPDGTHTFQGKTVVVKGGKVLEVK